MSKAKDLMGRSGAGGFGPVPSSLPKAAPAEPTDQKAVKKPDPNAPRGGQQQGGGKAPVARRPKV